MGPVPDTHDPSRPRRLVIGSDRKAILRGDKLDLALTLSGIPDRLWLDAFDQKDRTNALAVGLEALRRPWIVKDTIHWSIGKGDLVQAWWYLGRCVDRANAARFARERPAPRRAAVIEQQRPGDKPG